MKNLISKSIYLAVFVICMLGINTAEGQTSFNISNQTTGDTLLTIDNIGNVGIGTTTPGLRFDVLSTDPNISASFGLSNLDISHYLRFYSGRLNSPNPVILWNDGDSLRFGTSLNTFTEYMRLASNGYVGIGTRTPSEMLEVAGTIHSTVGGFRFPDGTLQATAAAGNIWNQNGSDIYFNGGNVGIGTSSTTYPLSIYASTSSRGLSILHNQSGTASTYGLNVDLYRTGTGNADAYGIRSTASNENGVWSTRGVMASATGNAPGPKYGVFAVADGEGSTHGIKGVANSASNGSQYGVFGEAMGSGTGSHYGVYGTTSGGGTNHWAGYFNGRVYVNANLGIGTSAPSEMLEVADTIYSSIGGFKFPDGTVQETAVLGGGVSEINDLSDARTLGYSVYLGEGSGIIDDGSDNYNTSIGIDAMHSNTNGYNNTAQGYRALYSNAQGDANTALGRSALESNITGHYNTALGLSALFHNTTGLNNVAIGNSANFRNQEGSQNTIVGVQAGYGAVLHNKSGNVFIGYNSGYNETGDNKLYIENSNSATPLIWGDFSTDSIRIHGDLHVTGDIYSDGLGSVSEINDLLDGKTGGGSVFLGPYAGQNDDASDNYNTAVGLTSLQYNTTGNENAAFGRSALRNNTTGFQNTAIGPYTLISNIDGIHNTATGTRALFYNTSGQRNTALGDNALFSNTTADDNTAVGMYALHDNTVGYANSALGNYALGSNTSGFRNTAMGFSANRFNTTGDFNVSIGYYANFFNETGSRNTLLGYMAGRGSTNHTKNDNVFVGHMSGYYETGDHKLYIENTDSSSPLIYGEFDNDILTVNGDLGVNNASPDANLHVDGYDGALFSGTFGSGSLPANGSGTRMMWYPRKAAFRVGYVSGTQWDDANIGDYSQAIGINTTASAYAALALGRSTEASATSATAMGYNTTASSNYATAMGYSTTAGGTASVAMGYNTTTSANYSTAMGRNVSTSGAGSFMIGDNSSGTTVHSNSTDNRFVSRFAGGYYLYTNSSANIGAALVAGANSWTVISDSTKKENFKSVYGEEFLKKISNFNLTSWNYKGQDPKQFRHYGPMAQDFYAAFGNDGIGTIGNDTTIASADFDGVNLIAIQALEKRTSKLQKENEQLRQENNQLKSQMNDLAKIVNAIKISMANLQQQNKNHNQNITLVNNQ